MGIKAVVIDFGGVLVRTLDHSGRVKWEQRLNLSEGELTRLVFDSRPARLASIGALPETAIWADLAGRFNLQPDQLADLQQDFWGGDRLDTGLVQFISDLRPTYKTALLSNAWTGARQTFIDKFQIAGAFDLMVISSEEGLTKPDPRIFHLLLDRLAVRPEQSVFIDDFPENIAAAGSLGMQAVQFHTTDQVKTDVLQILAETEPQFSSAERRSS